MLKWLFAILGSVFYKIPGGIAGFFIGSLLDNLVGSKANKSRGSVFNDMTRQSVSPADFEMQLISLCSIVIKADGKVSKTELDYVRQYFVQTYGKEKANAIFRTFNEVNKKHEISAKRICYYLNQRVRYEVRLQLVHFLFGIAQADGSVTAAEVEVIRDIAAYFKLGKRDYESVKAMFVASADTAYKILEIDKSATDDEVKKAYRSMAKKYHPDKVVTQNEAIKKGAEEKFKEVQKAYETIQKERGIS
ncbi:MULTISPECIES: TerB family tellurite resistance protein [Cellulophaga]|uniref:Heat shock protein DnaJ domain protein n=2 Tax=Cellulophaga TaxID=104264 RepID=F0RA79_CELLC|nr:MULTISPECIES: TerB family tellurite resistance protein [Cellulophaga]ADY29423.1 heat shock protein DnaJ domain protein [Cellulophaga lytica DSM 7489]AIM60435.1 molecular chaperone DnaJ [Cellulophaga lytica]EWH12501.1 heat shock protein DnaJ domain-containing protein [Cellulophaga geojensis KL-A]MDO6852208.1 TerB family tellurite resistance protein [Cellulophaga lytica]TVZ08036.1 DnaJ like chaperone protein [Cellulophaga sp. RHA_52]